MMGNVLLFLIRPGIIALGAFCIELWPFLVNHMFFKNCWKPSQKMRLDALIIFHIEWRHQVSCSMGKQSKYWSEENETENHVFFKYGWKPSQKTRLDALIIFHIEWQHQVSSLVGKMVNNRNTEAGTTKPKIMYFSRMAGNHLKDAPWCADHFPYWMTTPSV